MPFSFEPTALSGIVIITTRSFKDARGFFVESYKQSDFIQAGIPEIFVQDNFSSSVRGVLRGLHYQKAPAIQAKLVFVAMGEIFDVAVDLRKNSPTYGRWIGMILSQENRRMLYIPGGFAHGFCVLSKEACVNYKVSAEYNANLERGIIWNDPDLQIDWPIESPLLSPKDTQLPRLRHANCNFDF